MRDKRITLLTIASIALLISGFYLVQDRSLFGGALFGVISIWNLVIALS